MTYENTGETKLKCRSSGYAQTVPQFVRFETIFFVFWNGHSIRTKTFPEWYKHHIHTLCDIFIPWKTNMMYTKAWKTTWKCHSSFFNSKVSPPCSLRTKILIKNSIQRCVDGKIRMSAISFFSVWCSNTSLRTHNRCSLLQYFAPYPIDHSSFINSKRISAL